MRTFLPLFETPNGVEHIADPFNKHDGKVMCGIIAPNTWSPSAADWMSPSDWYEHDPEHRCWNCMNAYRARYHRKGRRVDGDEA